LLQLLVACVYNNCFGSGDAKKFDHCLGDLPAALKTLQIRERWEARHPLRNVPPELNIERYSVLKPKYWALLQTDYMADDSLDDFVSDSSDED
jgi:hypothetical protein